MRNPIMQFLNGASQSPKKSAKINPQTIAQAKRMMGMLKATKNPASIVQQLAGQNPMVNEVMRVVGNRDPQAVFYELCRQNDIDPEDILSELR